MIRKGIQASLFTHGFGSPPFVAPACLTKESPHGPPCAKLQQFHFFNASFSGATTTEMAQFVDRFAHGQSRVLIGLDACKDDPPKPQEDPFVPWRTSDVIDKTLSTQTLEYSIRTIKDYIIGTPPHMSSDGSFITDQRFEHYDIERPDRMRVRIEETSRYYENYVYPGQRRMESLRRIQAILQEREIPCVVFIPPLHEEVARHLQAGPGREGFRRWKAEVESMFPIVFDFSDSLWSASTNFFRLDPVHFKPQVVGVALLSAELRTTYLTTQSVAFVWAWPRGARTPASTSAGIAQGRFRVQFIAETRKTDLR